MRLLSAKRRRHRDGRPRFEAAGPTLGERFEAISGRGFARRGRVILFAVLLPLRLARSGASACVDICRAVLVQGSFGLRRRRVRDLLLGLPAVGATAAALMAWCLIAHERPALNGEYKRAAAAALVAGRADEARLFYERLYQLDGGSAETRLMLGIALEKLGRQAEAEQLIAGVAAGDAGGDPRANRWLAARLLGDPKVFGDPEKVREARRHLEKAELGLPRDTELKLIAAKFYLAIGRTSDAISRLQAAALSEPAADYDLARLYVAVGRPDAAAEALERATGYFRDRLESKPEDRRTRLLLASSVAALGRPADAVAVLQEGMFFDPEGPYGPAIASVYVAAYDRLAAQSYPDHKAMMEALREALRADPKSIEAAVRLAHFGGGPGPHELSTAIDPDVASETKRLLEQLLARGEQPPAVHMALGLSAWKSGDAGEAAWHFERAYDLDPSLAGVANNLAWALTHQEKPELDRALDIMTSVLARFGDVPAYRDTRGEIYLKLGRWEDALHDLEFALPDSRDDPRIHLSLAVAYENLGRPEIAERHRQEADRLAGGSKPATGAETQVLEGS